MSSLRNRRKEARLAREAKDQSLSMLFSIAFLVTIVLSFAMWFYVAHTEELTLTTTVVSGAAWLGFNVLFAIAIKTRWDCLFAHSSISPQNPVADHLKPPDVRRKSNWRWNLGTFVVSLAILALHFVLLVVLLIV